MANLSFYHNPTSKKSIFGKLMLVLVGPAFSTSSLAIVILFLSELQRVFLLLNITSLNFVYSSQFAKPFFDIIYYATDYLPTQTSSDITRLNIAVVFIFSFILILWSGVIIFLKGSMIQRINTQVITIIRRISYVYQGITYTVFQTLLVKSIQKLTNGEIKDVSDAYKNGMIVIMSLLIGLNFLTAFIIVLFSYEPLYFTSDVLARRSNLHLFLSFLEKTLIISLLAIIETKQQRVLITSLLTLLIELVYFVTFVKKLPYYNIRILKIETSFALITFFTSCINIGLTFLEDYTSLSFVLFGILLMIVFSIRLSHNIIDKKVHSALDKPPLDLTSETEIFLLFMMLEKIIGNGRFNPQYDQKRMPHPYPYYLMGIIGEHRKRCHIARCACKFYILKPMDTKTLNRQKTIDDIAEQRYFSIDEQNTLYEELMYFFKKDYLQKMAVIFPEWEHLKLTLANYIISKQCENKIKALLLVYDVENITESYVLKTKAVQLKEIIENAMKNEEKNMRNYRKEKIDVKNFIYSHQVFEELQKDINQQVDFHLKFWQELDVQEPILVNLLQRSNQCEKHYNKIQKKWLERQNKIDSTFLKIFFYYGLYLRIVKNTRQEAETILRKAMLGYKNTQNMQKADKGIDFETIYHESNIVIRISLQNDRFGEIIAVTDNVFEHFGYEPGVVLNQNVNFLMPEFIRVRHDDILRAFLSHGQQSFLHTNRKVFGIHKNGYIVPLVMYLTPFPYIDNDYSIMGILKRARLSEDIIMVTPDGMIKGVTKSIGDKLGLTPTTLFKANVSTYCEKFQQINMVFNYFAYIKMKSNQLRMKVYEQPDIFDKDDFADKSDLLAVGTDNLRTSNQRIITFEETQTMNVAREKSPETGTNTAKLMKSLKSSKFKKEFRESLMKAAEEKGSLKYKQESYNSVEMRSPEIKSPEIKPPAQNPIILEEDSMFYEKSTAAVLEKERGNNAYRKISAGMNSSNFEASPYMRGGGRDIESLRGQTKFSSYRSSYGSTSIKSFPTPGQKVVKNFQDVLKSDQTLKAYAPTHLPGFYARDSMLASRSLLERSSIFNKFAPLAKDLSHQAKILLHEQYKGIYEQFVYQGQTLRFARFDKSKLEMQEHFLYVKVHDEKVHHDILRIFTIANTEKRDENDITYTHLSSESYFLEDASIHSKIQKEEKNHLSPNMLSPDPTKFNSHLVPTYSDARSQRPEEKKQQRKRNPGNNHDDDDSIRIRGSKNPFLARLHRKALKIIDGETDDGNDGASSVNGRRSGRSLDRKVEKAINYNRVEKPFNKMFKAIFGLFLTTIGFLVAIAVNASQGTVQAWNIVGMLRDTYLRSINMLEVNRRLEQLRLTENGTMMIYSVDSLEKEIEDTIQLSQDLNNDLRRNFNSLGRQFEESAYNLKIAVKAEVDLLKGQEPQRKNTFDLIEEALNRMRRIMEFRRNEGDSEEIANLTQYVYQNIMGGTGIFLNQLKDIEIENSRQVLSDTKMVNQYVFLSNAVLVFIVLVYMVMNEKAFLARKRFFLNIWCTVPPKDIRLYRNNLLEFNELINMENEGRMFIPKKLQFNYGSMSSFKKDVKRTKEGNFRWISRRGLVNLLIEASVLLTLVFMAGFLFLESLKIETEFNTGTLRLGRVFDDYHDVQLGITSLYLYLGGNQDIIVKNQPVAQMLDELLQNLRKVNEIFLALKGDDRIIEEKLEQFLKGNLCEKAFSNETRCLTVAGGVVTRGLSAIQSLLAESMIEIKLQYESDDSSIKDLRIIMGLQSFLEMESLYSNYTRETFDSLTMMLETDFHSQVDDKNANYTRIIIAFGAIVVLVLMPLNEIGRRSMFQDRINLRRMLRMVSTNYILEQKIFKAALIRDVGTDINFL